MLKYSTIEFRPASELNIKKISRLTVYLFLVLILAQTALGISPSDLDPTFGTAGIVTTNITDFDDEGLAVALQTDGKIVVAGYSNGKNGDMTVVRYNTNGTLDSSFDGDGYAVLNIGDRDYAYAVAIQSDGKIVLGGSSDDKFTLVRFNSSGSVDTSFGIGGKVITASVGKFSYVYSLAIQSDGKIIAVGSASEDGLDDFALARYQSNGSLDNSFGVNGIVKTDFSNVTIKMDRAYDVKLQPDGKIVAGGSSLDLDTFTSSFAVSRYNTNGSLDLTFDSDGKTATVTGGEAYDLAIQTDGKIIAAGSGDDYYLVRYNINGALDGTFGTGGIVTTNVGGTPESAKGLVLDSLGRIILAGSSISDGEEDAVLVRYLTSGALDASFDGDDGIAKTSFGSDSDIVYGVVRQTDGRIIVAGSVGDSITGQKFSVARFYGDLQPTAANVTISGRVLSENGSGLSGARVTLSSSSGSPTTLTNSFGYYHFYNVQAGDTYIIVPRAKACSSFSPTALVLNVTEDVNGANFVCIQ